MEGIGLYEYWKKYIDCRKMYRVFPKEFEEDIRKKGLCSRNNPYKHKYSDIKKLFKILHWLEKRQKFNHTQIWGRVVNAEQIMRITLDDMKKEYLDFTPHLEEVKYYKKLMKNTGSALSSTIKLITQDILLRKPTLKTKRDYDLVKSLNYWSKQRGKYDLVVIYIRGSCTSFEKATYQTKDGKKLPSPFGSFRHFKKIIKKYGLKRYSGRLEGNPRVKPNHKTNFFNLRVRGKIPSGDIVFIKS